MTELPDSKARKEALNPRRSFIVAAPAGAGKTQILVKRYLALLKDAQSLDSVVALTFTNRAAEEMRERIFTALRKAGSGEEGRDDNEKELFSLAGEALKNDRLPKEELFSLTSFRISTFHSFCSDILGSYPLESKVSPGFLVYEEADADKAYESAAEEVVSLSLHEPGGELAGAVTRRLAALGGNSGGLVKQIATLIKERDRAGLSPKMSFHRREEMVSYILGQYGKDIRDYLLEHIARYKELPPAIQGSSKDLSVPCEVPALRRESLNEWRDIAGVFLTTNGELRSQKGLTPANGFPAGFRERCGEFLTGLPEACCSQLRDLSRVASKSKYKIYENAYKDLQMILEKATDLLFPWAFAKKLDFVELEASAVRALMTDKGAPTRAMSSLHSRIRHILVDEAQDLGDAELTIIRSLAEGWEEGDGSTIFIVGDPKQSIYRFRKANVAIFQRLMDEGLPRESEAPLKLEKKKLKVNFRSAPQILDFVNSLFEPLMKRKPFLDGVEFSDFLHPETGKGSPKFRSAGDKGNEAVTIAAFKDDETLLDWFVGELKSLLKSAGEDEEIALLYHKRSAFQPYLKALQRAGIEVNVVDGDKLEVLPAAKHLFNLLKAVTNLRDDMSWALILGAPWFDLGPAEILELSKIEGCWSDKILKGGIIDGNKIRAVEKAVREFYEIPKGRSLYGLWLELGGPSLYSSRYGLKGVEQARLFFQLLEDIAFLPGPGLVAQMKLLLSSKYSGPDPEASLSKIKAMTVHKAKGLEFDNVFVLGLDSDPKKKGRGNDNKPLVVERLKFNEEAGCFEFYDAPYEKKELCFEILKDLDSKRGEEEFLRQNYVALTRAKKRLWLLGNMKAANKNSFLKKVTEHFGITAEEAAAGERPEKEKAERKPRRMNRSSISKLEPPPVPYTIARASEEAGAPGDGQPCEPISGEEGREQRIKGIAIHKILERLARGGSLPSEKSLEAWLLWNREPATKEMISEVLDEAGNAWRCGELQGMIASARLIPEWQLEMASGEKEVTVGRIDLLIEKKGEFFVVDYKSGKPSLDKDEWIKSKMEEYRYQLETYKKMVSSIKNIAEEKVRSYILFTSIPELSEVK